MLVERLRQSFSYRSLIVEYECTLFFLKVLIVCLYRYDSLDPSVPLAFIKQSY